MDNDEAEDRTFEKALSARNKNQPKLMDDVRNKFRMLHRGKRTEEAYVGWIRRYLLFEDIRTIQELLGHVDVSTTMIYTHVSMLGASGVKSPLDNLL